MLEDIRAWRGEDGKYHRKRSSYSDFTDYSMCSSQRGMVRVGGMPEVYASLLKSVRCPKCFKERNAERD